MKEYIKPQLEVIEYSLDDVISASPATGKPETGVPEQIVNGDDFGDFFG